MVTLTPPPTHGTVPVAIDAAGAAEDAVAHRRALAQHGALSVLERTAILVDERLHESRPSADKLVGKRSCKLIEKSALKVPGPRPGERGPKGLARLPRYMYLEKRGCKYM